MYTQRMVIETLSAYCYICTVCLCILGTLLYECILNLSGQSAVLAIINELGALCEVVPNTLYAMLNGEQLDWEQTRHE